MIHRVASAAVLVPLVLVSLFYFPSPLFILVVDALLLLVLLELFGLFSAYGVPRYPATIVFTLALPWIWTYRLAQFPPYLLLVTLALLSWTVLQTGGEMKKGLSSASANLLAFLYAGVPLSIAALLQSNRERELLLVLLVVWGGDTAAFAVGKLWGKHKITSRISPDKSLEGYLAGMAGSVLIAVLAGPLVLENWSSLSCFIAGLLLGLSGILGDLFESILKRGAGFKNSSNLIPGHGGLLDRVDSLLFALPAYYLLADLLV